MSKAQNPLTGQMSGSMGNFVTTRLGDKNIIRAKAFEPRDAKTEAQLKQRDGFKLIVDLFPALGSIPTEGFVQRPANASVYTAFIADNIPEAIDKSGETVVIDYKKLVVSDGSLSKVIVTETTLDETGITVRYLPSLKNELNKPTDEIVALALLASRELWVERKPRGSELTDSVLIPVTNVTATDILGIYVFAKRADGSKSSKTVYVHP